MQEERKRWGLRVPPLLDRAIEYRAQLERRSKESLIIGALEDQFAYEIEIMRELDGKERPRLVSPV